jgi:glycosyltransferase involved in cell wall biosynthesis
VSDLPDLIYLADVRMPTEKAHGWQIMKMCEAFAERGVSVELRVPRRRQYDANMPRDPFDYYGLKRSFRVRHVTDLDVVAMEPRLPVRLAEPVLQAHAAIWEAAAVAALLRTKPDLIYTRDLGVAVACATAGLPCAYEVHAMPGVRARAAIRRVAGRPEPRAVVALTPFIADALIEAGYGSERVIVEGDAVDGSSFSGVPTKAQARSRLGISRDAKVVGFAGRFTAMEQERGLDLLIGALAQLEDALLILVGGPMDAEADLVRAARASGLPSQRLLVHDRIPNQEVPTWLRAFDVVAMPYPNTKHYALELSPLKLFEAMAAGVPIVATDLPSARLMLRDGENALLVPPDDPAALAAALSKVLDEPALRRRLASKARADVAPLTWNARAGRILEASGMKG